MKTIKYPIIVMLVITVLTGCSDGKEELKTPELTAYDSILSKTQLKGFDLYSWPENGDYNTLY
jgi:hypothetical protein